MVIKKRAQATLELAISFIGVFILLLGAIKVFTWVNTRMVQRQRDYEATRVGAGSASVEKQVDESDTAKYPKLNILN